MENMGLVLIALIIGTAYKKFLFWEWMMEMSPKSAISSATDLWNSQNSLFS